MKKQEIKKWIQFPNGISIGDILYKQSNKKVAKKIHLVLSIDENQHRDEIMTIFSNVLGVQRYNNIIARYF